MRNLSSKSFETYQLYQAEPWLERDGLGEVALCIGYFDGVHKAHQQLIDRLRVVSELEALTPVVYTFDWLDKKSDREVTWPELTELQQDFGKRIQTNESRALHLLDLGVRLVWEQAFTDEFRQIEALDFLEKLCKDFHLRHLIVGEDFCFGYQRKGNAALLRAFCAERGIGLTLVPAVRFGEEVVSSSQIRGLLLEGKLVEAEQLLGHPFQIRGPVVHGRALGRTVGMPTANMELHRQQLLLPLGVYASRTRVGDRYYNSISHIGLRPTVSKDEKEPLLETFLLEMEADLYGQVLEVDLLFFIREEAVFPSLEVMRETVEHDLKICQAFLNQRERLMPVLSVAGVTLHHLASERYTQAAAYLEGRVRSDLKRNPARALAQRLAMKASERFPSSRAFRQFLDYQYGADVEAFVERDGHLQSLNFHLTSTLQGLDGEKPFLESLLALLDQLRAPLWDESACFDCQLFEAEKQNLYMELLSYKQNKARYAASRAMSHALGQVPEAYESMGKAEDVLALTREEVSQAYREWLAEADFQLVTAGQLSTEDFDAIAKALQAYQSLRPTKEGSVNPFASTSRLRPRLFGLETRGLLVEEERLQQVRLYVLYRGLERYPLQNTATLNVLNSLLGGDVHSLLFTEVRERLGLAYAIHSYPLLPLSAMAVSGGLEAERWEEGLAAVRAQVRLIQQGDFSERLFENSKAMVRSKLKQLSDSLQGHLAYQQRALQLRHLQEAQEGLVALEAVRKEDVVELAQQLEEASVYVLKPQKEDAR